MPVVRAMPPKSSDWPEKTPTCIAVGEEVADQRLAVVGRRQPPVNRLCSDWVVKPTWL